MGSLVAGRLDGWVLPLTTKKEVLTNIRLTEKQQLLHHVQVIIKLEFQFQFQSSLLSQNSYQIETTEFSSLSHLVKTTLSLVNIIMNISNVINPKSTSLSIPEFSRFLLYNNNH